MDLAHNRRELNNLQGGVEELLYAGTITGAGNTKASNPKYVMPFKEGTFFLNVTAFTGTDCTVKVLTKHPKQDKWEDLVAFTQATGVTSERKAVAANLGDVIALDWSGTLTSVTFACYAVLKVF